MQSQNVFRDEPKVWPYLVIGAGIIGSCTALQLRRHGLEVALIDPLDASRAASYGNAGVISAGSIFPIASPSVKEKRWTYLRGHDPGVRVRWGQLPFIRPWLRQFDRACALDAQQRTVDWLAEFTRQAFPAHQRLADLLGSHQHLSYPGWLKAYRDSKAWEKAAGEREMLQQKGISIELLNAAQLNELEPALARVFSNACLIRDAAAVQAPERLVSLVHRAFVDAGGVLIRGQVRRLGQTESGPDHPVSVHCADLQMLARQVVIAAGAWSHQLVDPILGRRIAFASERGYHQHFALRPGHARLGRAVYDVAKGLVLSPQGHDADQLPIPQGSQVIRVLTGVELGTVDMTPSFAMLDRCIAEAKSLLPLLPEPLAQPWVGNRPSTPDGLPVIGWASARKRVMLAFGHGHIGFSTGPLTAELVTRELLGNQPFSINAQFEAGSSRGPQPLPDTPPLDLAACSVQRLLQ